MSPGRWSGPQPGRRRVPRASRWGLALLLASSLAAVGLAASGPVSGAAAPSRLVFVQSLDRGFSFHVFTAGEAGERRRRVSTRRAVGRPSVSPEGGRIAFAGPLTDDSDGRYALYVVDVRGTGLRRITAPVYADLDPAWSPDGRWIAFSRSTRGNLNRPCCVLGMISTDGRRRIRLLANTGGGTHPAWSPDSRQLAFTGMGGIWVVRSDGSRPRLLVRGRASQPAWSPDGQRIAFVQHLSETRSRIVTVASTGGQARVVENMTGLVEAPVWGPDSRTLWFVYYHGLGDEGRTDAAVWRASGGRVVRLFRYPTPLYGLNHWGPTAPAAR